VLDACQLAGLTLELPSRTLAVTPMFLRLTWRTRFFARVLAVVVLAGTALPAALHGGMDDDPLCDSQFAGPAATGRIGGDVAAPAPQHCLICHWLRSIRIFHKPLGPVAIAVGCTVVPQAANVRPAAAFSWGAISARAPPA
jgi:hypothetical protein